MLIEMGRASKPHTPAAVPAGVAKITGKSEMKLDVSLYSLKEGVWLSVAARCAGLHKCGLLGQAGAVWRG